MTLGMSVRLESLRRLLDVLGCGEVLGFRGLVGRGRRGRFSGDPYFLARPALRPFRGRERSARSRPFGWPGLDEVLDHEAVRPQQPYPVPVSDVELDGIAS